MKDNFIAENKFINEFSDKYGKGMLYLKKNVERGFPSFELVLIHHDLIMEDQIVLQNQSEFKSIINNLGEKYFNCKASFNNTVRIFWFIKD